MATASAPRKLPRVLACVAPRRRKRLASSLEDAAILEFCETFAAIGAALEDDEPCALIILDTRDRDGMDASTAASEMAARCTVPPIVMYATHGELTNGALASPDISDLIIADETDAPVMIQWIVRRAIRRVAADRVVAALRSRINGAIGVFAETAVRYPACSTVEGLSEHLGIHRQTAGVWCRKERLLRPEELLIWCRTLLVAALLEQTGFSVGEIAVDLEFPSVVSLRNQLKRYTGMTALEIRDAGLDAVLRVFDAAIRDVRQEQQLPTAAIGVPILRN